MNCPAFFLFLWNPERELSWGGIPEIFAHFCLKQYCRLKREFVCPIFSITFFLKRNGENRSPDPIVVMIR